MGRKTVKDPAIYRLNFRLTAADHAKVMELFRLSGQKNLSVFIVSMLLSREMKVVKIDKAAADYYMRLTEFYHQYQAIGNNYNQLVKAIKTNFGHKRGLAMLYRMEKTTLELIAVSKRLFVLTDEFERKHLGK